MKKLLFTLTIFMFACSPQKRISNIYYKHPELKPVESVKTVIQEKEVIKYRDTTVYVDLPGIDRIDTVYKTKKIYITKKGEITSDTVNVSSIFANSWAWVANKRLNIGIADKDTTLQIRLNNALMDVSKYKYQLELKTVVTVERYTPMFIKLMAWIGGILIIAIILYIIYRIKGATIRKYARHFRDQFK